MTWGGFGLYSCPPLGQLPPGAELEPHGAKAPLA